MAFASTYLPHVKQNLKLALPIIAGQLGQVLMGFFDTVQIGGLGQEYIAASGFANGLYWMTVLSGMGILFAVSPLVSKAIGEKKGYKSVGVLISGMIVSVALTILFTGAIWVLAENIAVFRHSESDNRLGGKFLHVINYSTGFVFFFMAAKQFLDGMGRTKIGMIVTLGGLALNYVLNWLLIYGNLGFPRLEIEGAAIANGISRVVMTVAILFYIWRDKQVQELRKEFLKQPHSNFSFVKPILMMGIPTGLQFFWEIAAFNAGLIMSGWISVTAEAAHMVAIGLASITFMVAMGLSSAGTILVGFAFGEKEKENIRLAGNTAILLTVGFEVFCACFFLLSREMLPKLYTDNSEVISIASAMLVYAALFQISDGLQVTGAGILRGMQDVKTPAVLAFVSYWLVMIPSCYILTFTFNLGLRGIWIGFIIGLSLAAVLLLTRFKILVRQTHF